MLHIFKTIFSYVQPWRGASDNIIFILSIKLPEIKINISTQNKYFHEICHREKPNLTKTPETYLEICETSEATSTAKVLNHFHIRSFIISFSSRISSVNVTKSAETSFLHSVQGIIISVISVYAQQCGLDNSRKDDFYSTLIDVARKFGGKEIVIIARYFNG